MCRIFYIAFFVSVCLLRADDNNSADSKAPLYVREFCSKLGIAIEQNTQRVDVDQVISAEAARQGVGRLVDVATRARNDSGGGAYFYTREITGALVFGRKFTLKTEYRLLEIYFFKKDEKFSRVMLMESVIR